MSEGYRCFYLTASTSPSMVIPKSASPLSPNYYHCVPNLGSSELTEAEGGERRPEAAMPCMEWREADRGCNKNLFSFDGPKERERDLRTENAECDKRLFPLVDPAARRRLAIGWHLRITAAGQAPISCESGTAR